MVDFSHIEKVRDTILQADLDVHVNGTYIGTLTLDPATSQNTRYRDASLAMYREARTAGGTQEKRIKRGEEGLREVFADHVLRGWSGVVDASGAAVSWTRDAGLAFLMALPDEVFEGIVNFATNANNFRPRLAMTDAQVEDKAGN